MSTMSNLEDLVSTPSLIQEVSFKEYEGFEAAIQGADLQFTITQPQVFFWSLSQFDLADSCHIQSGFEGAGSIAEGVTGKDQFIFYFHRCQASAKANGVSLERGSVVLLPPGSEFCIASESIQQWVSLALPIDLARSIGLLPIDRNVASPSAHVFQTLGTAESQMWSLITRFTNNARTEPGILKELASLAVFHEDLLASISNLYGYSEDRLTTKPGRPSVIDFPLISSAVEMLEDLPGDIVTIKDLIAATGISERTLQKGFQKFFGMSPQKYLQFRRLRQARKLLCDPQNGNVTITQIAATCGMWDFGRFASRYQQVFGELPSTTLRRVRKPS